MDKETRGNIEQATQKARRLLEAEFGEQLEGRFDVLLNGEIPVDAGGHLTPGERLVREKIVAAVLHKRASGMKPAAAAADYLRDCAFTTLNRFVALKMLEARELVQECVSRGDQSSGFKEFCGLAPGVPLLPNGLDKLSGYRLYIENIFDELSQEVRVLFDRRDPASLLWPDRKALADLLDVLNNPKLEGVWKEDETIGWVYQHFNTDAERRETRGEARQAPPPNGRELAVRNQFFTPRYVVEFLTDNTLGRTWYEMRKGQTALKEHCQYLVRRPTEIFLREGEKAPSDGVTLDGLSQEEVLRMPVHVAHRAKKDPRDIKILDPACGSGHFLLYAFDVLVTIYKEGWDDPESARSEVTGRTLRADYEELADLHTAIPGLILRHNLYGIDIDSRCVQIAALALWMRAQRRFKDDGIPRAERPKIKRTNIVLAEPMPGEKDMVEDFAAGLEPPVLGDLFGVIASRLQLAGELGSLIKIDQEIERSIARLERETRQGSMFTRPVDSEFWNGAEKALATALAAYASRTGEGDTTRRRIFAEDAGHGLALVDLLRNKYDVVLMNPPFGEACPESSAYAAAQYPTWNKNLLCCCIELAGNRVASDGLVGVIYDRTANIKSTYEDFRTSILLGLCRFQVAVDLGWDVLDAQVEVTSGVFMPGSTGAATGTFIDVRHVPTETKDAALLEAIHLAKVGDLPLDLYIVNPEMFLDLPNAVIGYDFPQFLVTAFSHESSLEEAGFKAYQGHALKADKHFRLWYEVPVDSLLSGLARPMYNGSEFSEYTTTHRDVAIIRCDWEHFPKDSATVIRNPTQHGKSGVCFGKRGDWLDAHLLPEGRVFTVEGQAIPIQDDTDLLCILGLLNTSLFRFGINLYCGQHKYSGYVNLFPVLMPEDRKGVAQHVVQILVARTAIGALDETQPVFARPAFTTCLAHMDILASTVRSIQEQLANLSTVTDHAKAQAEAAFRTVYAVPYVENERLDAVATKLTREVGPFEDLPYEPEELSRFVAEDAVSFGIGCAFGRWRATGYTTENTSAAIDLGRLPLFPAIQTDGQFPGADEAGGFSILVDDAGHPADGVKKIQDALKIVTGSGFDSFWQDVTAVLAPNAPAGDGMRQWWRHNFFSRHVERYSKSRRKAPIYWQLATPSASYSVWLYYHRLTRDTFFKVLNDHVTPKVQHEERKLDSLRSSYGPNATELQRKEIATQALFVDELCTFREDIARIAPLWKPDLNDGVNINFAPLWRLVPQFSAWQKDLKECWDRVVNEECEWSYLAMHLWPERVIPKCTTDRSLAIAHELADAFWSEDHAGKWKPRQVPKAEVERLVRERTSPAVKAALQSLLNAPTPGGSGTRRKTRKA